MRGSGELDTFQDARLALYLVRLLSILEQSRPTTPGLDELIREEQRRNTLSDGRLVSQVVFLQFAYMTLVRLNERYFKDNAKCLDQRLGPYVPKVIILEQHNRTSQPSATELARWLRNAFSHDHVQWREEKFWLRDENKRPKDSDKWSWVEFEIDWPVLGQICEAVVFAGNDLLYPRWDAATP